MIPYTKLTKDKTDVCCKVLKPNPYLNVRATMDHTDTRSRKDRRLPDFMFNASFPKDHIGSGGATYGGALEWMEKHISYFNQSTRFVQKYPNLVQEKCMDKYWDFMEPLIYNNNLLTRYEDYLKTQFGFKETFQIGEHFTSPLPTAAQFFKSEKDTRKEEYSYPVRRAFFCYDRTCPRALNIKHLIVDALEPYLNIRTNPTPEQSKSLNSLDVCRAICGSVFVFFCTDKLLRDQVAMHLLSIALAYRTPIIFIRESGYKLPLDIKDERIAYVKLPEDAPFQPQYAEVTENKTRKLGGVKADSSEIRSSDPSESIIREKEKQRAASKVLADRTCSLETSIKEAFANAVVFNLTMFESTMGALCDRLSALTGVTFPAEFPQVKPGDGGRMGSFVAGKPTPRTAAPRHSIPHSTQPHLNTNNNNFDTSPDDGYMSANHSQTGSIINERLTTPNSDMRPTSSESIRSIRETPSREPDIHSKAIPTPPQHIQIKKAYLGQAPFYHGYLNRGLMSGRMLRYRISGSQPSSPKTRSYLLTSIQKNAQCLVTG